jgi:hypothetical protein
MEKDRENNVKDCQKKRDRQRDSEKRNKQTES